MLRQLTGLLYKPVHRCLSKGETPLGWTQGFFGILHSWLGVSNWW